MTVLILCCSAVVSKYNVFGQCIYLYVLRFSVNKMECGSACIGFGSICL